MTQRGGSQARWPEERRGEQDLRLAVQYHSDPVPPPAGGGGTSYLTSDHLGSTRESGLPIGWCRACEIAILSKRHWRVRRSTRKVFDYQILEAFNNGAFFENQDEPFDPRRLLDIVTVFRGVRHLWPAGFP
jgi:hypothetical protein